MNEDNFYENNFYDDDSSRDEAYDENQINVNNQNSEESNNGKKWIIVIMILVILIIILLFIINGFGNKNNNSVLNESLLVSKVVDLEVGEIQKIEYKELEENDKMVEITWVSSDESIVIVDNTGTIEALKEGTVTIFASYLLNGISYEEQCQINVISNVVNDDQDDNNENDNSENNVNKDDNKEEPKDNNDDKKDEDNQEVVKDTEKPTINYTMSNGSNDTWTNSDVTITINARDNSGIVNVKYALNCSSNCEYTSVTNNTIKVNKEGANTITIVASDNSNNSVSKTINVKIDKTKPTLTLSETIKETIYDNTGTKEICALCKDNGSGCKQEKVCKTFSSTAENVTLDVLDVAGNKTSSQTISVIVDKEKPKCSLKISSLGKLTGSYSENGGSGISYYGFSSSYSGNNATYRTVGTGTHKYYVKDKAGNTNSCSLTVKSRNVNCTCPSGYSVNSNISSSKCYREDRRAAWNVISEEIVSSADCKTTCSATTTASTCVTCETISGTMNVNKITKKATCSSGRVLYNANCYYETNKTCQTEYYS